VTGGASGQHAARWLLTALSRTAVALTANVSPAEDLRKLAESLLP
jgi:hypothetical protein